MKKYIVIFIFAAILSAILGSCSFDEKSDVTSSQIPSSGESAPEEIAPEETTDVTTEREYSNNY